MIKINDNPSCRELRQFAGIWFPTFWLIVAGFLWASGADRSALVAGTLGIMMGAVGVAEPRFIHPIYLLWMYGAYPIGYVVSHVLMGVIFYGLLTPIGLVMKVVGYDPLQRRLRSGATTYWEQCAPAGNKRQYFRQF